MKKARMNIFHSRFILFKLKIFGEIVTTNKLSQKKIRYYIIINKVSAVAFQQAMLY